MIIIIIIFTTNSEYCPEHLDERVPCAEVGNSCYCFSKLQVRQFLFVFTLKFTFCFLREIGQPHKNFVERTICFCWVLKRKMKLNLLITTLKIQVKKSTFFDIFLKNIWQSKINNCTYWNNYWFNVLIGLPKDFYWTSGSDEANEGQWIWTSTQENITVTNWRNNQPDGGKKENCLYLHSRDEFKWGDWMCNLSQYFICEW
jgi:hypothetical protein